MRRFVFVPFGERAPAGAISCDGLIPGAALDLSHWAGNRTPAAYKRDTSTEAALAYVAATSGVDEPSLVVNNHFDTDGVLSVWTLLEPESAAGHAARLVAAAEAGDFGEWPDDPWGLRLCLAIEALGAQADDDRDAYQHVLPRLAELVAQIADRGDLWRDGWLEHEEALERAGQGDLTVSQHGSIAVFAHRAGTAAMPPGVLNRLCPAGCRRRLLAFEREGAHFDYRYERPGWAWADTVVRPRLPPPDKVALSEALGPEWIFAGDLGMTGICATGSPVEIAPDALAELLLAADTTA